MVYEARDGGLTPFFDAVTESPLMRSDQLRHLLREGTASQSAPFIHRSSYDCWFAGLHAKDGFLYMTYRNQNSACEITHNQLPLTERVQTDDVTKQSLDDFGSTL